MNYLLNSLNIFLISRYIELFLFLPLNVLLLWYSSKRIVLMTCLSSISRHSYLSEILQHLVNFRKELWVQKIRIIYLYGFYIRKKKNMEKKRALGKENCLFTQLGLLVFLCNSKSISDYLESRDPIKCCFCIKGKCRTFNLYYVFGNI